eukprot:gene12956-biopygen18527
MGVNPRSGPPPPPPWGNRTVARAWRGHGAGISCHPWTRKCDALNSEDRPRPCGRPPLSRWRPRSPAGKNGSGRGPDAGRTMQTKETDAGRMRAVPFLTGPRRTCVRCGSGWPLHGSTRTSS